MARVTFGGQLIRHVGGAVEPIDVGGGTVGEALEAAFARVPAVKGYVVDEQGRVRKHVAVFIDGRALVDRARLEQPIAAGADIHVLQALSGG